MGYLISFLVAENGDFAVSSRNKARAWQELVVVIIISHLWKFSISTTNLFPHSVCWSHPSMLRITTSLGLVCR